MSNHKPAERDDTARVPSSADRASTFIVEKIDGLRLAIECEELIVAHLKPEVEKLLASKLDNPIPYDRRRCIQSADSKGNIRRWKEELTAWEQFAATRDALTALEDACEALAASRPSHVYEAMIDAGQTDELLALDTARRNARALLAKPHTADEGATTPRVATEQE